MTELVQEQLRMLLRTKMTVIDVVKVYQGTVNAVSTRIAEIPRTGCWANVPGIIVVHNHPSGDESRRALTWRQAASCSSSRRGCWTSSCTAT